MITLIVFCTFRVTLNIPNQDLVENKGICARKEFEMGFFYFTRNI